MVKAGRLTNLDRYGWRAAVVLQAPQTLLRDPRYFVGR